LDRWLCGPQSQSVHCGESISVAPAGSQTQFPRPPSPHPIAIPSELSHSS
jgi:hypothetical protein